MRTKLLILLMACMATGLYGQGWKLISEVQHPNLDQFFTDQLGNIYVTDRAGVLTKYTPEGKRLLEYAPVRVASVQQIAVGTQLKVMLFYQNLQEFLILDRYLSFPVDYRLNDFNMGFVEHLAPINPQQIWLLDISDFSIKLLDLRENRLIERKSLAKVLSQESIDIHSFHAHQNRLYLVDQMSGIQVFDNIGNYLFKLADTGLPVIGFDKDYLYYEEDGKLVFVHLYDEKDHSLELPQKKVEKIRYTNGYLTLVTGKGFNIYKYLSPE